MAIDLAQPTLWDSAHFGARGKGLEAQFEEFHIANPHVYRELRSLALELKAKGVEHYGMKSLIEVLRWHRVMETSDPEYKINNNWAPFYARLLMQQEPALRGFFETRTQTWQEHEVN